jgi:hypothetical protein
MKNCSSCGQPINDAKFCGHCGESQVCVNCGNEFMENEKFCTACGTQKGNPSNHQSGEQGTPVQSPPIKQPFNVKNVPWFVWLLGAIVVIFVGFKVFGGPNTPEEVVESFFEAAEKKDVKEIRRYVDSEDFDIDDVLSIPSDAKFDIVDFDEVEIRGNTAYVVAFVKMSSKSLEYSETDDLEFELEKINGNWVITDGDF